LKKDEILEAIIKTPKPLSEEQRRAILSDKRYLRVVAGAGTGKTETLTRRIAYLLLHEEEEPKSIVAFTFTERAAQSMKSRIHERVRQLKREDICAKLGEMYIGTIHGYCLRILEELFDYGDYDVLDEHQEMAFLLREGWGLGLGKNRGYIEDCETFLRSVNVIYDGLINRQELHEKVPDFLSRLETYEELLEEHKFLTFSRMIYLAVEKLDLKPRALAGIKHLIVDEYQDINRSQEKLIQLIGRHASVYIVGDPRQSIYQWRGSDERCFDDFLRNFPDCEKVTIKENRRSLKSIVKMANRFAETFKRAKYDPLAHVRKGEGVVTLVKCNTNKSEAEWVAAQIERLVKNEKICSYSDIAILLRSVTTSARPFLDSFRDRGIPFIVGGKVGLFQRDEAQAVGRLFAWLWDFGFWVEDPYNWNKNITGEKLLKTAIEKWKGACGFAPTRLHEKLESWKRRVKADKFSNFTKMYHELLVILGYKKLDQSNKLQAAIMANLGRFSSLLADYESSIRLGGQRPDWQKALKGLCWYLNAYAMGAYEEQLPEDLRGIEAVQVMTVHQAKGLEWPIVFLPCLVSRRFPSSKIGSKQDWFVPREMFDVARYEGDEEDERRLFYVAITRARDILILSNFKRMRNRVGPSIFLSPIMSDVVKVDERNIIQPEKIEKRPAEEEIQTFSAREIITYLRCPYLYRLREVWGYKPGLVAELGYGKSLHYCLRCVGEAIKRGINPEEAVRNIVNKKFHLPYANPIQKVKMKGAAEKALAQFVKHHIKDMQRIEEVEARLEFPLERTTITGRLDVIIRSTKGPTFEVRDYKTSDDVTPFEHSSLQVKLYSLGLRSIGYQVTKASVAYLDSNEIKDVSVSDTELQIASDIARRCIQGIVENDFAGKPGSHCDDCDHALICRYKKTTGKEGLLRYFGGT
jgi:DNA helicase-2/ATP-dependent DNA helicase PcrA